MDEPILLKFDSLEEEVLFLRSGYARLKEENARLLEENNRLEHQSKRPNVFPTNPDIEVLIQQIDKLKEDNARLLSQLAQKAVKKNSNNSSIAPSHDISRKNKSLLGPSGRPVGGQLGHPGTTLLHFEAPTETEDLVPDFCDRCGGSLAPGEAFFYDRHQVVDIPQPAPLVCKEYRRSGRKCTCRKTVKLPAYPNGAAGHIQYGPNIQALVAYLWQCQFLPFDRLQQWFWDVLGARISKGTLENIIRKVAGRLRHAYGLIRQRLGLSACVGPDETGISVDGKKNWVWTWQDRSLTYLACPESRGAKTIKEHFPNGFLDAVPVSDRWGAQLGTAAAGHQLCLAHILRDLNYIIGLEAGCTVAPRLKALLQKSIAHKKAHAESAPDNGTCMSMEGEMDLVLHEEVDKQKDPQTAKLQKSLLKHRGYLFRFLYHKEVPFDNNASERGIRMVKVKQKVSGCLKSLQEEFCIIKSVVDTAFKNGSRPFDTIKMAVANMAG